MFTDAFIKEQNLSEAQIGAITQAVKGHYDTSVIPELKKGWDGKANSNAEAILEGASAAVAKTFDLEIPREEGEKFADYLKRISDKVFESERTKLGKSQKDLDEKLKNFQGDSEWKNKYEDIFAKFDSAQEKLAKLEPLADIEGKYSSLQENYASLQKVAAFSQIKPSFPKEVNSYEAEAKWNAFVQGVLAANELEVSDKGAFAVDKENPHKKTLLKDLLSANKEIQDLLKGRQQEGLDSRQEGKVDIEGIPFDVPKGADSAEITKLVKAHLKEKLGNTMHPEYSKQFQEMYAKIKKSL